MKNIVLTKNMTALVDDEDYESLAAYKWYAQGKNGRFYARRRSGGKLLAMHTVIVSPPKGNVVDHINGSSLDNRRANLRICTNKQNSRNSRHGRGKSRYKGVQLRVNRGKRGNIECWIAVIRVDGRLIYLGQYKCQTEAAKAYDQAAREYFGEFACLNFPATL